MLLYRTNKLYFIKKEVDFMSPIDQNGMNSDYISYFSLEEYIERIKLLPSLLEHLEQTNKDFDDYMNRLAKYDENYIVNYWIYLLYEELKNNQGIEYSKFNETSVVGKDVFFDTLNISHKRIHQLHNFIESEKEPLFQYRDTPVNVSYYDENGQEHIYWRGVNPEDVNKFMSNFVNIYKQSRTSLLFSNPFLVSSLMHLLFVRIHPYPDGNGRTARLIHNIKFTESINKLYGMKLKISPLNLSGSILLNKITYAKRIDNIYFDVQHDTNENINKWFNFILDMADEQIYLATERLTFASEEYLKDINGLTPKDKKTGSKGLIKTIKTINTSRK